MSFFLLTTKNPVNSRPHYGEIYRASYIREIGKQLRLDNKILENTEKIILKKIKHGVTNQPIFEFENNLIACESQYNDYLINMFAYIVENNKNFWFVMEDGGESLKNKIKNYFELDAQHQKVGKGKILQRMYLNNIFYSQRSCFLSW